MAIRRSCLRQTIFLGLAISLLCCLLPGKSLAAEQITVRYSHGFAVAYRDGVTLIKVTNPWPGASTSFKYLLKPRGLATPSGYDGYQVIETPVRSMVALSTTPSWPLSIGLGWLTGWWASVTLPGSIPPRYVKPPGRDGSRRWDRIQRCRSRPSLIYVRR